VPLNRLLQLILGQTPAVPVALVRIIIGVVTAVRAVEAWRIMARVFAPGLLRLPYVSWLPEPSLTLIALLTLTWFAGAIAFCLGWHTRIAGSLLFATMSVTLLLDQQTYSNHLYLLVLVVLLLTLADAGAALSLDARRKGPRSEVPAWPVLLLKLQVSIVYGFSAIAKITPVYLSGLVIAINLRKSGPLSIPMEWRTPGIMSTLAVFSVATEAFLAVALWLPRWRWPAAIIGIGFHVTLVLLLIPEVAVQLAVFAVATLALYLLFFNLADRGVNLQHRHPVHE
jgi:hypothetical protein